MWPERWRLPTGGRKNTKALKVSDFTASQMESLRAYYDTQSGKASPGSNIPRPSHSHSNHTGQPVTGTYTSHSTGASNSLWKTTTYAPLDDELYEERLAALTTEVGELKDMLGAAWAAIEELQQVVDGNDT